MVREFSKTWWGKKWILALESFGWANRLQRGRSYARGGHVLEFHLKPGRVTAKVQGRRPKPYRVTIGLKTFSLKQWRIITDYLASQAIFAAKLLSGEMPENIEDTFNKLKRSLLSTTPKDLVTDCSCPDWANPCKHIAAVHYILAGEFDKDPFLIFELQGMTKERLLENLRISRLQKSPLKISARESRSPKLIYLESPPVCDSLERFWKGKDLSLLPKLPYSLTLVHGAIIKKLGLPRFWKEREFFIELMEDIYRTVSTNVRLRE